MIECQVKQGCEVGITVRHNDNVDFLRLFYFAFLFANFQPKWTCGGALSIEELHLMSHFAKCRKSAIVEGNAMVLWRQHDAFLWTECFLRSVIKRSDA